MLSAMIILLRTRSLKDRQGTDLRGKHMNDYSYEYIIIYSQ